ncbi:RES family NAD+ phosphorylase [Methylomicrobium lacus]|uniref:RES family NAD+ phosphorylase n=1 Tax=Methylomicrobium lacus TaxID=136992 RepID=UPI00045E76D2|nr:RES domain-containing protein [Methylomicrobium lacus]
MTLAVRHFTGLVYRAHHPRWAFTPLSGEGAKKYGGRFNRPGSEALYTSLDLTTAWMEAQQGFPFKPQPMTMVAYQVNCADIADLQDLAVQQSLDYDSTDLGCAWEDLALQNREPPTWRLADRLQAQGIAGILVRSFAPGCTDDSRNLVLWQWSNAEPHAIQIIDDQNRLPKTQDSWV